LKTSKDITDLHSRINLELGAVQVGHQFDHPITEDLDFTLALLGIQFDTLDVVHGRSVVVRLSGCPNVLLARVAVSASSCC